MLPSTREGEGAFASSTDIDVIRIDDCCTTRSDPTLRTSDLWRPDVPGSPSASSFVGSLLPPRALSTVKVEMSTDVCEGCRRLRRKCVDDCILRPCLEVLWEKNRSAQGNATHFLAKSLGRNKFNKLLSDVPDHHRPALLQSLLNESCARMINPVSGIAGLMVSNKSHLLDQAIRAVLNGDYRSASDISLSGGAVEMALPVAPAVSSPTLELEPFSIERSFKRPKREMDQDDELPQLVVEHPQRGDWRRSLNLDLSLS